MQRWRGLDDVPPVGSLRRHDRRLRRRPPRARPDHRRGGGGRELGLPERPHHLRPAPGRGRATRLHPAQLTTSRAAPNWSRNWASMSSARCRSPSSSPTHPAEFVHRALVDRLHAAGVSSGENFRFGHRAAGDVATLTAWASAFGFEATGIDLLRGGERPISATYIRSCVEAGDCRRRRAGARPPPSGGRPGRARRPARARARISDRQPAHRAYAAVPADGVYAGRVVRLDDEGRRTGRLGLAAISVGTNPTFEGHQRRVEAFSWTSRRPLRPDSGSSSSHRLRGMERFDSIDALVDQMDRDVELTRGCCRS